MELKLNVAQNQTKTLRKVCPFYILAPTQSRTSRVYYNRHKDDKRILPSPLQYREEIRWLIGHTNDRTQEMFPDSRLMRL